MKILLLICCLWSFTAISQTCLADFDEASLEQQFIDNGDGTASNAQLGLMWMRCSLGQTWQNETCVGDASELNWQQALQTAHGFKYAEKLGWRVPNIKELSSLTERQCVRPAINEIFFPNTPSDDFWTSTPSVADAQSAWVVAFHNSSNALKAKNLTVFTRLVRNVD